MSQQPLSTFFLKPISRPIEGVIKADDNAQLRTELEEYVVTQEVARRLEEFLEKYTGTTPDNGAWISGFFGSGKSHLLKMLARLLEGYTFEDGYSFLDAFVEKTDDRFLQGELRKIGRIPAQSILFNIDQKADTKAGFDALLKVFQQVFDENLGYYGKVPHIAQFERDLDDHNLYKPFQDAFARHAGKPWQRGRETAGFNKRHIAAAYADITGTDAADHRTLLDNYRADYALSIENFAELVNRYLSRHPDPAFRLNFFVDEVGQFIADEIKLMTNLQTVAESLATRCDGRAWIIVTAQGEIDQVIGEVKRGRTGGAGDDFSKIQGRFKVRMKLTGGNVAEVIRRRLLEKTPAARLVLAALYEREKNNFRTLFDFRDSRKFQNFRDKEHFVSSYPFVPYQYDLFQTAITSLSQKGAFEGRHTSVGERSMLAVFQNVARQIENARLGELATFDLMYAGIETVLKSRFTASITQARNNLDNPYAVRVLKALFLVKYVDGFKANAHNITVLMTDRLEGNPTELRERVQAALDLLENQTYIQRTGDLYSFLTDEEKDVERSIKAIDIAWEEIRKHLGKLVFEDLLATNKLQHPQRSADLYYYSRKVDDQVQGREHELSINLITPDHEYSGAIKTLRSQNLDRPELLVIMPQSRRLMNDITRFLQTARYVRHNTTAVRTASVKAILDRKSAENHTRAGQIRSELENTLAHAHLIAFGRDVDSSSQHAKTRILEGANALLTRVYTNLNMLGTARA